LLLWWALEDKAGTDPAEVVNLFEDDFFWKNKIVAGTLVERMMQRFAQSGTRNELLLCAKLLELAPDKASSEKLMAGFEAAYKGRSLAGLPAELTTALTNAGGGSLALRIRQNDEKAIAEGLQMIADPKADTFKRTELVQTFGEVSVPDSVPVLLQLLASDAEAKNDSLLAAVLTALQTYTGSEIGEAVVKRYPTLSKETQPVAQTLLSSRKDWSRQLLEAIDAGSIDKETLPLDLVRKMTIHSDDRIAALIGQHWGNLGGASSAEMQALIQKLSKEINSDSSDPYRGRALFKETCGKCHLLYGEGGRIGPDLTSFKRDDTLNMLINVVNPSAEIREGFETMSVITDDGRVLTGFLADQDNRVIVLRGVDGQNITIERDSIEDMVRQKKSLMPEGLLDKLDVQQVRDLFAYLRGSQPLNR
ncbi:MAG TPA: dehydrogenase, partial [Planctomycetaceae bacterium]|nr:dehydrogenase [Planctomycetaceae bacterium]